MTNFADRTIWTGDNLDILRGLNSVSVDLIYLDPPFNSNDPLLRRRKLGLAILLKSRSSFWKT